MSEFLIKLIEGVIAKQEAELTPSSKSDKIYDKKLKDGSGKYDYEPRTIYFTYVGLDEKREKLRIDHYFYPDGDPKGTGTWDIIKHPKDTTSNSKLKDLIKQLAENAIGSNIAPKPYAFNFDKIEWRRKSYIVFFFDDVSWKLHKFDNGKQAVVFYDDKLNAPYTPNHSFYDALDFATVVIKDNNGKNRNGQAVAFINHMKKADGTDIATASDSEEYQFGMYFDVELLTGNKGLMAFVIDPGGTNQGPIINP